MTSLGKFKQGDDLLLASIEVTDENNDPVDLSGQDYIVRCHVKSHPESSGFVNVDIDAPSLGSGLVVLSIARAVSETMDCGMWYGDVEVTGPAGRQSSATFSFQLLLDITKDEEA